MRRLAFAMTVVCLGTLGAASAAGESVRQTRWARIVLADDLPADLTNPEGRTTWDLSSVRTERPWVRQIRPVDSEGVFEIVDHGLGRERSAFRSRTLGPLDEAGGAELWLLPDRDGSLLASATTSALEIVEREEPAGSTRFRIERRRVGMGWLRLPAGPREVVLQRALVFRETAGGRGWAPDRLVHRWIDPLAGVVAEIEGPVSPDGTTRLGVSAASVLEGIDQGQAGLKDYSFMMDPPVLTRLSYGYDRKGVCTIGGNLCVSDDDCMAGGGDACSVPISVLTPDQYATAGELVGAASWDFSANGFDLKRYETAQTISPINANETCSWDKCGFTRPGAKLGRQDTNFDDPPNADITTTVLERELRTDGNGDPIDVTLWLRAGVNHEGQTGSLGSGESRICYVDGGRTPVPLWRFPHEDATGWYWMVGDTWSSDSNPATPEADPFLCENTIFVHTCPNSCGLFCANYIRDCSGYSGTQGSAAIAEGPVTLPSGHTFNSLLVRNVAEFCVYIGSSCASPVFRVRTVVYLWEVPWLGTVVRLTSAQDVTDYTSFTTVEETDIKHGLFPPRSISTGAIGDTSVEVLWDPGLDTHRIDGFNVYWTTTSGDYSAADSVFQPAGAGNSAVVDGLTPGTQYFFTVTAVSDFTNPATLETTTYESLMYPMTAPATPEPIPMEATATTSGGSCVPTAEVSGLTVAPAAGGNIELCWEPALDPCLTGYQILGAQSPESDAQFVSLVEDTGLMTCQTIVPTHAYYLVAARGSGGTGPWGHFGR